MEVDDTYVGGKRKNMSKSKREDLTDRGSVGKTAVVGARDREANQVAAKVVTSTDQQTLQGFVKEQAAQDATVYTDDAEAYETLPFNHDSPTHSLQEYVKGALHTNGIESLWSLLKRAHKGTFNKLSPEHLDRYVQEFAGRHNLREQDTIEMIRSMRDAWTASDSRTTHSSLRTGLLLEPGRKCVRGSTSNGSNPSRPPSG